MSDIQTLMNELLRQAGLSQSRIDVLPVTGAVTGLAVSGRSGLRSIVEELQSLFQMDAVESGGRLRLIPRAGQAVAALTEDDLLPLAESRADAPRELYEINRLPDSMLSEQVDVVYLDADSDYQRATQTALRQVAPVATRRRTIEATIAMEASRARRLADMSLDTEWSERFSLRFSLGTRHAKLEAGDIVDLFLHGVNWRVRITKITSRGTRFTVEAVTTKAAAYQQISTGDSPASSARVLIAKPCTLYALDLPVVDENDDSSGFFTIIGRAPADNAWRNATLYQSTDNLRFEVDTLTFRTASHGTASSVLADCPNPASWDRAGEVTITLIDGALSSLPETDILNGANVALLGDEIIQFASATLTAANTYILRTLLRGRRGTEHATATHQSGERFLLLDKSLLKRPIALDRLGQPLWLKALSNGQRLDNTTAITLTPQARCLKPLSPVHARASRQSNDDRLIQWIRRTRFGGGWLDSRDAALDEASEHYRLEILSGTVVKRTITTSSSAYTYTAAEQIADFGSLPASLILRITQLSSRVGAGHPQTFTL